MVAITHVGLSVPDIDRAIEWYTEVLGFELIAGPYTANVEEEEAPHLDQDLFGPRVKKKRNAHLSASNQIGLELFEFQQPQTEGQPVEPWAPGFFHICVINPDVDKLAEKIVETGGERVSQTWQLQEGKPYYMVYCKDPFGNLIEIYSRSTEQIYANKDQ